MEGMAGAAPFYRTAVGKAELELQGHPPEDPNDIVVIHALAQMGVWLPFSERVYPTLVRIFQLIRDHTPPHTGLYYRAEILLANSLYEVGRGVDKSSNLKAAAIYQSMLEQPDVQQWPKTALTSLHWALGSALYQGDQFAEAAPHFQAAGELDSQSYAGWARQFYVAALAKAGRIEDAKREYAIWVAESKPTPGNADHISRTIALMEQKYPVKKDEKENGGSPPRIDAPNVDADH